MLRSVPRPSCVAHDITAQHWEGGTLHLFPVSSAPLLPAPRCPLGVLAASRWLPAHMERIILFPVEIGIHFLWVLLHNSDQASCLVVFKYVEHGLYRSVLLNCVCLPLLYAASTTCCSTQSWAFHFPAKSLLPAFSTGKISKMMMIIIINIIIKKKEVLQLFNCCCNSSLHTAKD